MTVRPSALAAWAFLIAAFCCLSGCSPRNERPELPRVISVQDLDAGVHVAGMAAGPDGDVWLATLNYGNGPSGAIHVLTNGRVERYPRRESFNRVAVDASGVAWLTGGSGSSGQQPKLVRIDRRGREKDYPLPAEGDFEGITIGHDGAPWFVDAAASEILRLAPSGDISSFGPSSADPTEITAASDGDLWFTEPAANLVGKLTPNGTLHEFRLPRSASRPTGISADARGNVWFCESAGNKLAHITSAGKIDEINLPTPNSWPAGIIVARDGTLWSTELATSRVARAQPAGRAGWKISEYALPGGGYPGPIVRAPDGSVWITSNAKRDAVVGLIESRSHLIHFSPTP